MNFRRIFLIYLVCSLAINFAHGQIIADFTFDDDSDMPASLLTNRVGEDAIDINPNARSDGDGVYTLVDPNNPDEHQNIDLKIPKSLLSEYPSIFLEWEFRCQEENSWLINGGENNHSGIFHHEVRGFRIRYYTQTAPDSEPEFFDTDFTPPTIPPLERGVKNTVSFYYNQEEGIAYLFINNEEIWKSTDHFEPTPGEALYWHTEEDFLLVGAGMNGDESTTPSLYRFRIFEEPCPDVDTPTLVEEESTLEVCSGEQAVLTVDGAEDGNYRWYDGMEALSPLEGETNSMFISPPIQEDHSYFVAITDGDCEGERKEIPIVKLDLPAPPVIAGEHQRCGPGEITLEVSGGDEGRYSWYETEEAASPIPGAVNSSLTIDHLEQSKTYYVRIEGDNCQSQPTAVEALINPVPDKPEVEHSLPCEGETISISISNPQQGIEYLWYPAGDNRSLHQGSSLSLQTAHDTLVYVRASNGLCNSEPVLIELNLVKKPEVNAGEDLSILKGESIDLQASGNYASLQWQPHESLQFPDSPSPRVNPTYTHTYLVTAVNEQGCEKTDSVTVHVLDEFPVPNAFSPNSDGQNDAWEIPNIDNYPDASLKVFNRWGNEVFSSRGYTSPWDGSHNGQPLPTGTYYFILDLGNETAPVKGTVMILR